MSNFVVNTVPADGLAPLGARPSAGTVMIKIIHLYIQDWHLKGQQPVLTAGD